MLEPLFPPSFALSSLPLNNVLPLIRTPRCWRMLANTTFLPLPVSPASRWGRWSCAIMSSLGFKDSVTWLSQSENAAARCPGCRLSQAVVQNVLELLQRLHLNRARGGRGRGRASRAPALSLCAPISISLSRSVASRSLRSA